jgi:hypothetical protein
MRLCGVALVVVGVVVGMLALGGCGRAKQAVDTMKAGQDLERTGKATITTPEGETTIETPKGKDTGDVKVTTKDEKGQTVTYEASTDVDTSKLGLEIYPGAKQEEGSAVAGGEANMTVVKFSTSDGFDKVAAFYKGKYPKAQAFESKSDGSKSLMMTFQGDNSGKMVMVGEQDGVVSIVLQSSEDKSKGK